MDKSDHEEADSRISLHVHYTLRKGATSILVRTVDTHVVVILVEILYCLVHQYPEYRSVGWIWCREALSVISH